MKVLGWILLIFAGVTCILPFLWVFSFPCGLIGAILLLAASVQGKRRDERAMEAAAVERVSNSMFGR